MIFKTLEFNRINRSLMFLYPCLAILSLIFSGCQRIGKPPLISAIYPQDGSALSAYGWIGAAFSEAMDKESVENALKLTPDVVGETFWQNNTLWFRPIQSFEQNSAYQVQLAGNLQTADGQTFSVNQSWSFTIREPLLIYYVPMGESGEIWRASSNGDEPQPLSQTDGNVLEFSPDQSGSWIVFSVLNEIGGQDLWLTNRDGEEQRLFLECGSDRCSEPVWSMDQSLIAYTRVRYLPETGGFQSSQVWIAEVPTGETEALYQTEIISGHSPSFSPDGSSIAFYDADHAGIRVFDLQTRQDFIIPRTLPGTVDWSWDGSEFIFTDLVKATLEPFVEIYIARLEDQQVSPAFGTATSDTDFSQPRWSPDGGWLAVSLRPVNAEISKELWVLSLNDQNPIRVDSDPTATFSAYQWDPWGRRLVYQRSTLGSSNLQPSIWLWVWENNQAQLIIENGARPIWLP